MRQLTVVLLLVLLTGTCAVAATDTLKVHTSAVCEMCKESIEKDLSFEKGVKSSELDVTTKDLTVVYDPAKTSPAKIRQRISKIGYDADEVKRDPKAFKRLPDCCKKDCSMH